MEKTTLMELKGIAIVFSSLILGSCGGSDGDSCDSLGDQSFVSAQPIYTFRSDLFEVDNVSATWTNNTSGESGTADITEVDGCFILLGCGTAVQITFTIPLVAGKNDIDFEKTYVRDGEEECRNFTYHITF